MMKKLILLGLVLIMLFSVALMLGSCEPTPSSGSEDSRESDTSNPESGQNVGDNDVTWSWDTTSD